MIFLTVIAFVLNVAAACICGNWIIEDYTQKGEVNAIAVVLTVLNVICAVYNFYVFLVI